jgi:biopolymer transport protein ExbB/TolQ
VAVDSLTLIHWLLVALSALAAAFVAVVAWNLRGAMDRLQKVEDSKADKDDIAARFDEMAENQRQMAARFDKAHQDNTTRLDTILIQLTGVKR